MQEQRFWQLIDIILDLAFWGFAVIALLLGVVVAWVIWEDTRRIREKDREETVTEAEKREDIDIP